MLRNLVKAILLFSLLFSVNAVDAIDVVEVKPNIDLQESKITQNAIVNPIFPEKRSFKKKSGFFKRLKERVAKKKLSEFLQSFHFDSLKCDVITLNDGAEIEARILEVNTGAVLYELCDQENGPRRTLLNSKILMIEYTDGYKEVFKGNRNNDTITRERKGPSKNTWAIGFLLGVLLQLLGILIAYIIYMDEPYERKKAISGSVIGTLSIFLLAFWLASQL